jgi:hypothetical protein
MVNKYGYMIVVVLLVFCMPVFSQIDSVKTLFFVDGKRVFYSVIHNDLADNYYNGTEFRYQFLSGDGSRRIILLRYGEKYRNNTVYFYKTRKREDDEK